MDQIDFLDLMRSFQAANSLEAQEAILQRTLQNLGFKTFLYAVIPTSQDGDANEFLACTNFCNDWLAHYGEHALFNNDYAAHHVLNNDTPVIWHNMFEAIQDGHIEDRFKTTADATRDWSYTNGMSMPIDCIGACSSAFSVVIDEDVSQKEAKIELARHQDQLLTIANAFHASIERKILTQRHFNPSEREIEVLRWLSDGLTAKQIAYKTRRNVNTINRQIVSGRNRLGAATTVQAVAKAVMLGLI